MGGLPQDEPDFTPEWLSEVLGTDVTGVEVLGRTLATNLHLRLGLRHESPDAPTTIFVKLPPVDPAHRVAIGATGMGEREARFYAELAPSVPLRVPRTWFAATEADGSFVLLLEDLSVTGCRISDGTWGVPGDLAAGALEDLARFHVRFEDDQRRAAVERWTGSAPGEGSEFALRTLRHVLDQFADVLTPDYVEVGELYLAHHRELEALWGAGPRTVAHGDAHIGNVFVDGDRVGFLDWGLCKVSGPMRDVSYFLTMAVDPEDRRRMQEDLLRHYLDVRRSLGGAEIGFDEAWRSHRVHAGYTVIASFLGLVPPYDTEETRPFSTMFRERSYLALEDLGAVDALREALA
jgi:hypothetical protein